MYRKISKNQKFLVYEIFCKLFNAAITNSDYTASSEQMAIRNKFEKVG